MKTAILCIGNEIVEGHVLNTNALYFSSRLNNVGIEIHKHLTIIDEEGQIIEAIDYLKEDHDHIIVSGGLGPTGDDITKESIAKALGLQLEIDSHELTKLKDYFNNNGFIYTEVNDKQALYTELDTILINNNGTANGYYFVKDNIKYCVLPGPPNENRKMFDEYLQTLVSDELIEKNLYIINIGESSAETLMEHLYQKYPNIYIGTYMQDFGLIYRLKGTDKVQIENCFNDLKEIFKNEYLVDNDDPMTSFVEYLIKYNLSISFAESCTAGLACSYIASVPGSSAILNESLITYANTAKHKYLDVSWDILNNEGAVSPQCAKAMALGLREQTNSNINISITGIAGPDGGSDEKPVGLVYFCVDIDGELHQFKRNFRGNRNLIRTRAVKSIIFETYKILKCMI